MRPFSSYNTGTSDSPHMRNSLPNHCDDPQQRCVVRVRLNTENQCEQKKETANPQPGNSHSERPTETIQGPKPQENHLTKLTSPCLAIDYHVSISSRDRKSSSYDGLHGLETMYRNLTDNWTPLSLQLKAELKPGVAHDSDWLFGSVQIKKPSKNPSANRLARGRSLCIALHDTFLIGAVESLH